jgi:hypothetical protein
MQIMFSLQRIKEVRKCRYHITYLIENGTVTLFIFLQTLSVPSDLTKTQGRALNLKAMNFCINDNLLFWKNLIGLLLRCINQEEEAKVMIEFHNSECGGHHYWKTTAHKILRFGYYWPSLFLDVCDFFENM